MAFRRSFGIFFLQVSQRPKLPSLIRSNASWISWSSSLSFSMRPREMSCSKLSVPRSARCIGRVERSPAASVPFLQASSSRVFTSPCRTALRWRSRVLNSLSSALERPPLMGTILAGAGASAAGLTATGFAAAFGAGLAAGLLFFDFDFELTFAQHRLDSSNIPAVLLELRRILHDVGHLAEAELEEPFGELVQLLLQVLVGEFLVVFLLRHGASRPSCTAATSCGPR